MTPEKQRRAMQALSALAKFTGIYEQYRDMIKAFGLKWSVNNDNIVIARLIKYSSGQKTANDLFNWINKIKESIPEFKTFMDYIIATGLRLNEAITSYGLIVELEQEGKLHEYYNSERCVIEHFRYKSLFLKRTKKTYMSFVPKQLIQAVVSSDFYPTQDIIVRRISRRGLGHRFSDIRENWATKMTRYLSQPEIDFLQGRVNSSVFMQNYFNPTLINDLKDRVFNGIDNLILNRIESKKTETTPFSTPTINYSYNLTTEYQ